MVKKGVVFMQETITIRRKGDDDALFAAIIRYYQENDLPSAPQAVRELCEYALRVKHIIHNEEA